MSTDKEGLAAGELYLTIGHIAVSLLQAAIKTTSHNTQKAHIRARSHEWSGCYTEKHCL